MLLLQFSRLLPLWFCGEMQDEGKTGRAIGDNPGWRENKHHAIFFFRTSRRRFSKSYCLGNRGDLGQLGHSHPFVLCAFLL